MIIKGWVSASVYSYFEFVLFLIFPVVLFETDQVTDSAQIKQSPGVYLSYENSPLEANRGGPDVTTSSWVIG